MTEKFRTGSLVTYRVRNEFHPRTEAEIAALAAAHHMPASLVPAYAGDRAMVGKAIQSQIGPAKAAGWLVQPLETGKTKVVYTIARIDKDVERERTDYVHDDCVKWTSENGLGDQLEGWHPIVGPMNDAYRALRGMVLAGDWTKHIIEYIRGTCKGVAFLDSGSVYWVPPQGAAQVEALRAYLDAVGIGLLVAEIEPESHADVREVAQAGLAEQIEALRAEVAGFDGTQPPSVYRARLERLRELRATAMAYDAAIGIRLGDVRACLRDIDRHVRDALTVRLDTTVRKDGTTARREAPSVAAQVQAFQALVAQGDEALAQALSDGTLVLEADQEDLAQLADAPPLDAALTEALAGVDLDPALAALLVAPTTNGQAMPSTW